MIFQGALIRGICSDLTLEAAPDTVLFRDMVTRQRPLSEIARNAEKYVRCSFIGENIDDYEDIFDLYRTVDAAQVVFSDIHARDEWEGAMPPVDLAYRLELPIKNRSITPLDIRRWEARNGVKLSDALDVHWISLDPDLHFSIDEYVAKVLIPESPQKI
jgi:hypothetical protein